MDTIQNKLSALFENWAGERVININLLPQSGSYRRYFRIKGEKAEAIGVYNADKKENQAFIYFTKHFIKQGLKVPAIYAEDFENEIYLLEDLGDTTLFDYLTEKRKTGLFTDELLAVYKKVIEDLPRFQIYGNDGLDYSYCYPRSKFDKQSMMWDLNYFKYYFLKLSKIPFDEQNLEDDFESFTSFLLESPSDFFMYRDFQSRNIMIVNGEPFYIDYQGGRKGALQYDLASLLYDAKADIPQDIRVKLLQHYIVSLQGHLKFDKDKFVKYFYGFVLIRIMQALGAYGFRGYYEKREQVKTSD